MMKQIWVTMFLSLFLSSCSEWLMGEAPSTDSGQVYDLMWSEFDRLYPFFEERQVNWDSLGASLRPIAEKADEQELFFLLGSLISPLNDGHVRVNKGDSTLYSNAQARSVLSFLDTGIVRRKYITGEWLSGGQGRILYGKIDDIGYIHVTDFNDKGGILERTGEWVDDFAKVFSLFENSRGIVLDLRNNPGGAFFNALALAGHFSQHSYVALNMQFKDGPAREDFGPAKAWRVDPRSPILGDTPLRVVMDNHTASAAEICILALRELPQTMLIGLTTSGAMGTLIERELPNGWTYTLPVSRTFSSTMESFEARGISPDLKVGGSNMLLSLDKDAVLDSALASIP